MSKSFKQPEGLISVLLDAAAEFGDRHDAAMDLSAYDDAIAERALAVVACDLGAERDLADASGESLAIIWCRRNHLDEDVLVKLAPAAVEITLGTLEALSPGLFARARIVRPSL